GYLRYAVDVVSMVFKIMVEVDANTMSKVVQIELTIFIIHNIKELLARNWRVNVVHTLRDGNTCADYLAKLGARSLEAYSPLATPPVGMNLLLLANGSGTLFPR
ncbi:ribonuclease H, partial [Trifolium pratense]